jgi:hypothetical protein
MSREKLAPDILKFFKKFRMVWGDTQAANEGRL